MVVGFIETNKYNLDTFLINPHGVYSPYDERISNYKNLYINMCTNLTFDLPNNILTSVVNNIIECTITVRATSPLEYRSLFSSKWCVIYENNTVEGVVNPTFFVCKVKSLTRVDVNSYKLIAEIDNVRSFPMFNKVYNMLDEYNGDIYNSNYNIQLDKILHIDNFYTFNTNYNDYVVCAVIADEPFYGLTTEQLDNTIQQKWSNNQFDNNIRLCVFTTPINNLEIGGYKEYEEGNGVALITIENDAIAENAFNQTDLKISLDSFYTYIRYLNLKSSVDSNPLSNILTAFLIPRDMVSLLSTEDIYRTSYINTKFTTTTGATNEIIAQTDKRLLTNCLTISRDSRDIEDIREPQGTNNTIWCYGLPIKLETIRVYNGPYIVYLQSILKEKFKDYYNFNANDDFTNIAPDLIECVISTSDTTASVNYGDINERNLIITPYFNGGVAGFYVGFEEKPDTYTDTEYRWYGSFPLVPILTNGVERYINSLGEAQRINTVATVAGYGVSAIGGLASTAITKNPIPAVIGVSSAVTGLVKTINNYNYEKTSGYSIGTSIENLPTSVSPMLIGLFKITYKVANTYSKNNIKKEIDYFGVRSDSVFKYDFSNIEYTENVKYHKSKGGLFSSNDLAEIFSNGVFVIDLDFTNGTIVNWLTKIRNVLNKGVSYNVE